jgi:hypothetical protein
MPRPKSILQPIEVDIVQRAHSCQHNESYRPYKGDRQLKVKVKRSQEYYCVDCALKILERDSAKLQALARELRGEI